MKHICPNKHDWKKKKKKKEGRKEGRFVLELSMEKGSHGRHERKRERVSELCE